ncbi:MAG: calcineurin-like phosphoesterase C-terminal domain-containing protein [Bacteroidales bacterium]|nr:calcineurin-like phosphoesterase C-terminal domain-containing protein [Bacteroidales bacterium]
MKLTHVLAIVAILTANALSVSCDNNNTTGPEKPEDKIIASNISVPSQIEVEEGKTVQLILRGKTNVKTTDVVLLRSSANMDFNCPILSIEEGSSLEFSLPEDLLGGNFKVYIRRDGLNYYVGQTQISILKALTIEPEAGTNVYGIVECNGKGVPGVLLSDGDIFVRTNANGIYQMQSKKKWKYVFMVLPSGYEAPAQGVLPHIHATLDEGTSVAERRDFELIKTDNDNFTLFVLGDMHLANRTEDIKQFNEFARTLNSCINGVSGPSYVMTLGDMTWDLYWYSNSYEFPQYLSTMDSNFKNISFFHTMGNHDNDMNSVGDYNKAFHYTRDIAPTFYSFNIGKIHFVVMDNIDYNDVGTGADLRSHYKRNYTAEQMAWLVKDLSYVDKSTPVFITSHAPVSNPSGATGWNDNYLNGANDAGEANMKDFLAAVSSHNVHFLSGHTHNIFNRKHSDLFSEHNSGAVCASWWWSGHITPGIHLSQDGAPGGFGIWSFNGTSFTQTYRAAGHDSDYQFRAYDMNKVKEYITSSLGGGHKDFARFVNAVQSFPTNTILVNVWDYDQDWKVSISENGHELELTPVATYDPLHVVALSAPRCKSASANSTPSFLTSSWCHFFQARASAANSTVTIKVTDRNGKTYTETMKRPKALAISDYKNK